MILHYFLIEIKEIFMISIIRTTFIILGLISLLIIYRRASIAIQSGGSFFSSYKISDGFFYIHSGIMPGNRKILLKNISNVTIYLLSGRRVNGDRYHIMLKMRKGRNTAFMIGKSKKTEKEILDMKNQLKKNNVRIYYKDFTKK